MPRKTRFTQGTALMHENLVTPMHHHDEAKDTLLVDVDGQQRSMSACQADAYVTEHFDAPELTEVDHVEGGPRGIRRRHVLAGAGAGFGALLTSTVRPRYSFAAPAENGSGPQHLLVVVFMRGGFDGLSAVVPVADSAYYDARSTIAVRPEDTLSLDGTWGLNKNMSALEEAWRAGDLSIIQGAGTPDVTRSHFTDQASVERAAPANVRSGWLGRHLQTASSDTGTLRGISVGPSTVFSLSTTAFNTLAVSSIDEFDLTTWGSERMGDAMRSSLDAMYGTSGGQAQQQADATFAAIDQLQEIRTQVPMSSGAGYPDTAFAQGLGEIARMARANVGMEVACIDIDDWDMHQNLGAATDEQAWFSRRAKDFADSLAAFRKDMGEKWAHTTVVTMSEFGRRVSENAAGGLDHGQGNSMFVMGGGVKGGRVLGTVPSLAPSNLVLGDVPITVDYRQALTDIITTKLGNGANIGEIFPGFTPGEALGIV